ncbi:non-homologous end-joining DNA ligase [Segetibacter koreensis]|uniref:non-homologous end-joining DNA ligase n=1 Tax=Segetibacter koreensis TaxID=398037 RepID=UPI000363F3A3|nr:non-homologous end-joining DNA ligase [Segetibacter koreensis]
MPVETPVKKLENYIPAMLAKETDKPFSKEDWLYEIKWDGYRAIAEVNKKTVKLYSRNGNSFVAAYPEVVEELSKMKLNAVLDGEIVVLNEQGNPDFQKLQEYGINKSFPIQYYVFDLLELDGKKLYSMPLIERKKLLAEIIPKNPVVKYSDHVEESGEDFFELIKEKNLEGIMAKRAGSEYYPGKRTADWLKIKHHKSEDAIIAGFTAPRGGRKYFGALVLGTMVNGKLTYAGHTGSGFNSELLKEIFAKLQPLIREKSPFDEKVKTNMPVTWVEPFYVCEVKFSEWTSDGKLRHPIFLRMREDKQVKDITTQLINTDEMESVYTGAENPEANKKTQKKEIKQKVNSKKEISKEDKAGKKESVQNKTSAKKVPSETPASKPKAEKAKEEKSAVIKKSETKKDVVENEKTYKIGKAELKTTNRTKVFFPDEGITKGDVLDYYDKMSELIIPYIKDRPQSLFRTPNGISQKGFFHKDAGDEAPLWVKHIPLYSESNNKDVDYILCNDKATLLYLANLGCIEINPWHSRVKSLDNPDYMIIDIDPSDNNTFDQVIEAANVVKGILDKAGALSICKTSGASGLHVYVPLGKKYDYDHAKDFANLVCMMANQLIPEFTTLERSLTKRSKDKIYMDYLQNRKGQTIACVYSLRPKKGATVSTPLEWSEVKQGLSPKEFTINTIHERLQKKGDLFAPILDSKNGVDLAKCLENLEA